MEREYIKQEDGTGRMTFITQADKERGEYESVWPRTGEAPAGHSLRWRWDGMRLEFWIEPDPAKLAPVQPTEFAKAMVDVAAPVETGTRPEVRPTAPDLAGDAAIAELKRLEALPPAELETLAVEAGVKVKKGEPAAALAARVLEKRKAK